MARPAKKVLIHVTINTSTNLLLTKLAKKLGTTKSAIVRNGIIQELRAIVIEAVKWDGDFDTKPDWMRNNLSLWVDVEGNLVIETLEGQMTADVGDFVIKGTEDEIYPCKPDIFQVSYDEVDEQASKNKEGGVNE